MDEPVEQDTQPGLRVPTLAWVLGVVAVVLLPGLGRIVGERPYAARLEQAGLMTLIVALSAALLLGAFFYGSGGRLRWSLGMTTITTLILFHWPNLATGGEAVFDAIPLPILRDVVPVAFAVALLWLAARLAADAGFAIASGIALWGLALVLIAMAAPYVTNPPITPQPAEASPGSPDVVLIILDAYPRADVLAAGFELDNSGFLSELEARGFYIASEARSNYSYTHASVSTMFAMDYFLDLGPIDSTENAAIRGTLAGNSRLIQQFRDSGYAVTFFENAWEGSHCGPPIDHCIRDGVLERSIWNVGQLTILAPIFEATRPDPFTSVSLSHLTNLADIVTDPSMEGPVLTIAHFLLPHPPNLLDANCRINNTPERRGEELANAEDPETRRQFIRGQVTCVNSLILEQLDEILGADDDTVIMITGDHGYTSTAVANAELEAHSPQAAREQMSPLSAYRLPGCQEWTYPTMTPVNGVRAMTACALNTDFEQIPDISRWASLSGDHTITSLDGILHRQE